MCSAPTEGEHSGVYLHIRDGGSENGLQYIGASFDREEAHVSRWHEKGHLGGFYESIKVTRWSYNQVSIVSVDLKIFASELDPQLIFQGCTKAKHKAAEC